MAWSMPGRSLKRVSRAPSTGPARSAWTTIGLMGCLVLAGAFRVPAAPPDPAGITGVSAGPVRLVTPPDASADQVLRYGLGFPFQIGPRQAALLCNVRVEGVATVDYENGTDVIPFDDLAGIRAAQAVAISRNERSTDAAGTPRLTVKYPVIGGFVPLGARRPDGGPHPHAGSGFGLCQAITFPLDEAGHFNWKTERSHACEVHQFRYDGEHFTAGRGALDPARPHPPVGDTAWRISAPGITNAIPAGDDLLLAVQASDGARSLSGVVRWAGAAGTWAPAEFWPVTPLGESWSEASLVRDLDGALLFSARGSGGERLTEVRVWRRYDGGPQWRLVFSTADVRVLHKEESDPAWQQVIRAAGAHSPSPISINRAADGTPYISANLPESARETLCLWPLNPSRTGLETPVVVRAARPEFGAPKGDSRWMVDHPSGAVVRLRDGAWHAVLAYRILDSAEFRGAAPGPPTGCYVEEVFSVGPAVPTWRFDD